MAYYKILGCLIIVLGLIEFSLATSATTTKSLTPKDKLISYYESELTKINQEFCEKSKNLSEHLLKDERIQQANSTILLEFKKNITDYINKYESLASNKDYSTLVLQFSEKTLHYYHTTLQSDEDFAYILHLLKKLGFDEINNDFEHKLQNLFMKKLLEKFEEYKSSFKTGESEKDEPLVDWYNLIKTCKIPKCHSEAYYKFLKLMQTPKEDLYEFIIRSLKDLYIYYDDRAKNTSAEILKDDTLKNINTSEMQEFKQNLTRFVNEYHPNQDVYELYNITSFYMTLIWKYSAIPNDKLNTNTKLIQSVLKKFKTDELQKDFEHKFSEFVENKFIQKFEEFKLKLNKEQLIKEKVLLDWFEQFKTWKTYGEREQAFHILKEIFWQSDEKETN